MDCKKESDCANCPLLEKKLEDLRSKLLEKATRMFSDVTDYCDSVEFVNKVIELVDSVKSVEEKLDAIILLEKVNQVIDITPYRYPCNRKKLEMLVTQRK